MQSDVVSTPNTITILRKRYGDVPHAIFEDWADRVPDAIAVVGEKTMLTYAEVEQSANQIAHALQSAGVQRGDIVAVALERGPDLVCALLGVLKSGAAFAALDPHTPAESLARTLGTLEFSLLLTRREFSTALPHTSALALFFDTPGWFTHQPRTRPMPLAGSHDPACVLFTSGSTGHPKAALYLHRNLAARFSNTVQLVGLTPSSRLAQSSPISSIDAIDEILLPLVSGGSTIIVPHRAVTDPHQLIAVLSTKQVTHMLLVPSLLRVILSAEEDLDAKLSALTTWMVGGEPLTGSLARRFYDVLPKAVLINYYGLTEGDATWHITSPERNYGNSVPIGHPVRKTRVYLLDEKLNPVPEGKTGEIYLSGEGLFHEYVNCPELNADRWVCNPFDSDPTHARIFRTGDLGRSLANGEIEYVGRRDRMVKVRGFRVELGEVEAILTKHPAVEQCVVILQQPSRPDGASLRHPSLLIAYVVLKHGETVTPQELRNFSKQRLPEFAVPALVRVLGALPLLPNGKVDFNTLSQMDVWERSSCSHYVAPRNAIEARLSRIWEELLNNHPIGVMDSFFEIGGDSLAAIDLMLSIEKEFKRSLPITTLIQAPTIAGLAVWLGGTDQLENSGCLVPIRVQGSRPPLFCIHADGSVFIYRRFAEYLDENIPIYGLQARGLANPQDQPYRHVDEMAAHYVREIRTVQPQGPYHLCAFSAGGLIIFEMARQFQALGEDVAFLGLLDAYGPDYPEYLSTNKLADYKLSVHLNTLRLHGIKGQWDYLRGRVRHRVNVVLSKLFADYLLKLHLPMPPKVRYEYIARLIDRASQNYPRGRTYPGSAVLFHALTQPEGIKPDPALGWSVLITGELKIIDVVGTHNSIMAHEPHIAGLVRLIDMHLSQLQNNLSSEQAVTSARMELTLANSS